MKRLLLFLGAVLYVGVLLGDVPGLGVAVLVDCVVFTLAFPRYVQVDPCDTTSALDRLDGVGVQR